MRTGRISGAVLAGLCATMLFAVSASATGPETKNDVANEIKRLELELAKAIVANDVETLRRIESAGYVYTDSDAKVDGREDFIRAYQAGTSKVRSLVFEDLVVEAYGDAAVVRGVLTAERVTDGVTIRRVSRYTRFYVRFPQGWQAVAGHSSEMKQTSEKGTR